MKTFIISILIVFVPSSSKAQLFQKTYHWKNTMVQTGVDSLGNETYKELNRYNETGVVRLNKNTVHLDIERDRKKDIKYNFDRLQCLGDISCRGIGKRKLTKRRIQLSTIDINSLVLKVKVGKILTIYYFSKEM